ncbi:MAG TPA: hypothetical protein VJV23_12900, partial [Candidatus Polarisedimenticolia bacterium]|nr:hypothetical protein [Candidatus Polarisedimenticolia bacterium]
MSSIVVAWALGGAILAAPQVPSGDPVPLPGPHRVVRLAPVEAGTLPPALAAALTGMLEAALESSGGVEVVRPASGVERPAEPAGWDLQLGVSGRGPWRAWARA